MDDLRDQLAALVDGAEPVEPVEVSGPRPRRAAPVPRRGRPLAVAALVVAVLVGVVAAWAAVSGDSGDRTHVATGDAPSQPATGDDVECPDAPPGACEGAGGAAPSLSPPGSEDPVGPPGLDRDGLSTVGIGDLRFGASVEEAEARTGRVAVESGDDCEGGAVATITVDGLGLVFSDGRFERWTVSHPGWRTLSGVEVGMAAAEAMERVPDLGREAIGSAEYLTFPPIPTNVLMEVGPDDRVGTMNASIGRDLGPATGPC